MEHPGIIPHLFRQEYRRIVAVLCRRHGMGFMDEAEDIASSTFLAALETWPFNGVPPSPAGWLHTVARNKAINLLKRKGLFDRKIIPGLSHQEGDPEEQGDPDISEVIIRDSQLLMIFAVCDPAMAPEVQVALALRILCGFSIGEIASAFMASPDAIAKRIQRGKDRLRHGPGLPESMSPKLVEERSPMVMTTIYLLFNEGYHASTGELSIRKDLCAEAMNMMALLLDGPWADKTEAMALQALFCFHAARFDARLDATLDPVMLDEQDPEAWDRELISKGAMWMKRSARGDTVSRYHIEAMIAWWHVRPDAGPEKWTEILGLYDRLLRIEHHPVAAMNRLYVVARVHGKAEALRQADALGELEGPYGKGLMAWLLEELDPASSRRYLEEALGMATNPADIIALRRRMT